MAGVSPAIRLDSKLSVGAALLKTSREHAHKINWRWEVNVKLRGRPIHIIGQSALDKWRTMAQPTSDNTVRGVAPRRGTYPEGGSSS